MIAQGQLVAEKHAHWPVYLGYDSRAKILLNAADIWVSVDLTRPRAKLTGAIYGQGEAAGKPVAGVTEPAGPAKLAPKAWWVPGAVGVVADALETDSEHERAVGGWQAEWAAIPELFRFLQIYLTRYNPASPLGGNKIERLRWITQGTQS